MLNTTASYKTEMNKPFRDVAGVRVDIGIINPVAQNYSPDLSAQLLPYQAGSITNPRDNLINLAVWQNKGVAVDASQVFKGSDSYLYYYGFISAGMCNDLGVFPEQEVPTLQVQFTTALDLYGITLTFDKLLGGYATELIIETRDAMGTPTVKTVTNDSAKFQHLLGANDITFLSVKVTKWSIPNQHCLIASMVMGIGYSFGNYDISNTELLTHVDPLATLIPSYNFSFELTNFYNQYDFEDPSNFIWFVRDRQKVQVTYSQKTEKGIEYIPGGIYIVNEPPVVEQTRATISAGSVFDYLGEDFDSDGFKSTPITLYDMAKSLLTAINKFYLPQDLKVQYVLDTSMRNVSTVGILPKAPARDMLQYIANASMCTLLLDRQSQIVFRSTKLPEVVATAEEAYYSNIQSAMQGTAVAENYSRWSSRFFRVDGQDYFSPLYISPDNYLKTGYVSKAISELNGVFTDKPTITLTYSASTNVPRIILTTDIVKIVDMEIFTYKDGALQQTYSWHNAQDSYDVEFATQLIDVDKVTLRILSINQPDSVLIIKRIVCNTISDYLLARKNMLSEPTTTILKPLKEVRVFVYRYTKGSELIELGKKDVIVPADTSTTVNIDYDNAAVFSTYSQTGSLRISSVLDSAWSAELSVANYTAGPLSSTITLTGYEVQITKQEYVLPIQENGYVETVDNPLITSVEHAAKIADWVRDYASTPKKYEVPFRGDASLETCDLIKIETKAGATPLAMITDLDLIVGQGMTSTIGLKEF